MDKSKIYLQEAKAKADFAKRSFSAFRDAERRSSLFDVFFHLHHFLVHATNIDRILDTQPGSDRHAILDGRVDLSSVDLKPFRRLRNHLEHFDERLDRWVRDFDGQALFDMNIITGGKGFPAKAFLRALDGDIFRFHGESYDMVELYSAVVEIDRRLTTALDVER